MKIKHKNIHNVFLASTLSVLISGCILEKDSDDDNTPTNTTTTYNVTVDQPVLQKTGIRNKIGARDTLTADNFEVAIVDPDGNVVEIVNITSDNISTNPDGSYEISVPGNPRLDCVIVADLSGPISITVGNPLPPTVLFAPTTAIDVDIDVQSTLAYQNFIDTVSSFDDFTVEEVEDIVNEVQQIELSDPEPGQTLEEYLTAVEEQVTATIESSVEIAKTGEKGDLNALLEQGGGFQFEVKIGQYDVEFAYSMYHINGTTNIFNGDYYFHNGVDFVLDDEDYSCATENDCRYVLTENGWVQDSEDNLTRVKNSDGSITLSNALESYRLTSTAIDLSGENMSEHFSGRPQSPDVTQSLPETAVFSSDAEMHKVKTLRANSGYYIYPYTIDINTPDGSPIASLDQLIVETAMNSSDTDFSNTTGIFSYDYQSDDTFRFLLEFVQGGTLNFYNAGTAELLGAGTWEKQTVQGEEIIVVLTTPDNIEPENNEWETFYTMLNDTLSEGEYETPSYEFFLDWYNEIAFNDYLNNYFIPEISNELSKPNNTRKSDKQRRSARF